jgi:hypothetical protein
MPRTMAAQLINTRRRARVPVPDTPHSKQSVVQHPQTRDRPPRTNISRLTPGDLSFLYIQRSSVALALALALPLVAPDCS